MKQNTPTRHWSQLSTEEQILFWQDVDAGKTTSFLVPVKKKFTRHVRGNHSTRPKCEKPEWFRPARYKQLGGQLGYAYNRLVKKDPVSGQPRLRMRMSLHPYYITHRQQAGRKNHFKPEKARLLDASWPLWISFCDAGRHSVGMCITRLAHEVSPKDSKGNVIPETAVTVSRMSRLIAEQVRYGVLAVSDEKAWDRESGQWFPKYVWLTDTAFRMLGVDMEKLAKEQEKALRKSEERRQLIAEGIISGDEVISAHTARKRWYDKKRADALRFRRERGAMRKRASLLAKLPQDMQLFEMMKHIRRTMPAGESLFCNNDRLEQLAIHQLCQMNLFMAREAPA
ncbi:plasmid replication initiator RepA [[Erwinia] mediterraneensis]|uniref:plasmid replication initiator RepA n=1 Tax=[Erwinia] mediterraneensis TaxID=2161819 RepID=UPI0010322875|nr:plasmid replication initiator RepA [[Erwinia] mediterraneensis]